MDGRTRISVRLVSLRAANDAAIAKEAADKAIRSSHWSCNCGGICGAACGLGRLGSDGRSPSPSAPSASRSRAS